MKVLIVLTNVEKYEKIERPTGLWLSELTLFYKKWDRCRFCQS